MTPDEHTEQRRTAIVTAAREAFARGGYAQTTMDEIAAAAGISKGSLYNYFESKEALFEAVLRAYALGVEEEIEAALAEETSAGEQLTEMIRQWYRRLESIRDMSRLTLEFWATAAHTGPGRIGTTLSELYRRWRDRLAEIIAAGQAAGEFSERCDPAMQAALLLGLLDGIEMQTVLGTGVELTPVLMQAMVRQVLAGLGAPAAAPPKGGR